MSARLLPRRSVAELARRRAAALPAEAFAVAAPIVEAVRLGGEAALREYAERFGEVAVGGSLFLERSTLDRALSDLPASDRGRLERVAERIRRFAEAQKRALEAVTVALPGGGTGGPLSAALLGADDGSDGARSGRQRDLGRKPETWPDDSRRCGRRRC